ncbi:hypothetical protein SALBM135S_05571 [Streptomyces alboniger]
MFRGIHLGSRIVSGGTANSLSQLHQPNSESQMRVVTRAAPMPPCARIHSALRSMCGSLAPCPASRSPT